MRITQILLFSILLISCGTTGETVDSEPPDGIADGVTEIDESFLPEWYSVEKLGEAANGSLMGFAKSPGSDRDWAFENAKRQASVNLRVWIDNQLEEARSNVAESDETASDREFILQLRNAVSSLEFDNSVAESESFEDGENVLYVVMRIETSSDSVLEELEQKLANYSGVWNRMVETAPLADW